MHVSQSSTCFRVHRHAWETNTLACIGTRAPAHKRVVRTTRRRNSSDASRAPARVASAHASRSSTCFRRQRSAGEQTPTSIGSCARANGRSEAGLENPTHPPKVSARRVSYGRLIAASRNPTGLLSGSCAPRRRGTPSAGTKAGAKAARTDVLAAPCPGAPRTARPMARMCGLAPRARVRGVVRTPADPMAASVRAHRAGACAVSAGRCPPHGAHAPEPSRRMRSSSERSRSFSARTRAASSACWIASRLPRRFRIRRR